MPILQTKNLTKIFEIEIKKRWLDRLKWFFKPEYKQIKAVDNINLNIQAWEKVAFLWPNWAWKSTTIKMLTWILYPTSWSISVCWLDPTKERKKISYRIWVMFGQVSRLWYHLTPYDTFLLMWKLFDVPSKQLQNRLNYLIEQFDVKNFLNTPVRKLSLWQRIRCEIIANLIHKPQILFLDEPTIWLDIIAKEKLRNIVNQINKEEGTTIFLTSHDIADIESICERVIIINYGKIIYDGNIQKLKKDHIKHKILYIKTKHIQKIKDNLKLDIIKETWTNFKIKIENKKETINHIVSVLLKNYDIEDFSIQEPLLEDVIKGFY